MNKRQAKKAFKKKHGIAPEDKFDYMCACYDRAQKAFNSLFEDGHVKAILRHFDRIES